MPCFKTIVTLAGLLLMLAAFLQHGAAQTAELGELEVSELRSDSAASLVGTLAVMHSDHRDKAPAEGTLGRIELEADHLRVETDYRHSPLWLAGVEAASGETDARHTITEHEQAVAYTERVGDTGYIFIVPDQGSTPPQVRIESSTGLQVTQPLDRQVQQYDSWIAGGRDALSAPAQETMLVWAEETFRAIIEGDFIIVLWDWDLIVQDERGEHAVESGEQREETIGVPGSSVSGKGEIHYRLVYFFVEGGRLVLDIDLGHDVETYLAGGAMRTEELVLHHARGHLFSQQNVIEVHSPVLRLKGELEVRAQPRTESVGVHVSGQGVHAEYGGATVPLAPLPETPRLDPWTLLAVSGTLLVAALAAAWLAVPVLVAARATKAGEVHVPSPLPMRSRRGIGWAVLASRFRARGHPRTAHLLTQFAVHIDPGEPGHRLVRCETNVDLGRFRAALRDLRFLDAALADTGERAANACMAAAACLHLEAFEEAKQWLDLAVDLDRSVVTDMQRWLSPRWLRGFGAAGTGHMMAALGRPGHDDPAVG